MRLRKKDFIVVVSLLFAISVFGGYQNAFATFYNLQKPVAETNWLADNLNSPKVKIIFVDNWPSEKEAYEKGHIPGSVLMGVGAVMGAIGDGSEPPNKEQFEAMMHRLGVNNGDHVVLYGAKGESVFTLGALWLMEYFGHKNLSYLNGGLAKWSKENRPTKSGMEIAKESNYKAGSPNESIRADAAYVLKKLKNQDTALVDARGRGEFVGEVNNDKNKRVGHIPGANDFGFYKTNFKTSDGTFKSLEELKAIYEAKGVTKDKEVITYCQNYIKGANAYFTLKHVLGYNNVKLYVGWSEWGNRVDFDKYPAEK